MAARRRAAEPVEPDPEMPETDIAEAEETELLTSLTGKHLRDTARTLLGRAIPDEFVREVAAIAAPVSRYGGVSNASAAALSRALSLLAEPPVAPAPPSRAMTIQEIAEHVGRSRASVLAWADAGLLGPAQTRGRVRRWGRAGLERARLINYLVKHGHTTAELAAAAREDRLAYLVLETALSGGTRLTRAQVSKQAGVPPKLTEALTRALGIAPGEADEAVYNIKDVQAMRLIGALGSVYSEADITEVASVVSRAMHEVAEAALELFRRRFAGPFVQAGASELEMMLRLATVIDLTVPTTGPLLELVLRRQMEAVLRSETITELEKVGGATVDGQVQLAVGFADIVGFTALSARMSALEVSQLAAKLLHCGERAFGAPGLRIVKQIGDAVMFAAPDIVQASAAAVELMANADEAGLPPLRVGIAYGPVLHAYADYFGRTVNVASRLTELAKPRSIYVLEPEKPPPPSAWSRRRLRVAKAGNKRLRGISGRLPVLVVTSQA